jgi:DNA-binding transcriptional LysR family regulator
VSNMDIRISDTLVHMDKELDMRQLRVFLAVAETLHFGKAATSLKIAQPNLSQQIARSESILGHPLFERHAKGVTLTPVGEFMEQRARILQANFDAAIQAARQIGNGKAGKVIAGICGSVMLTPVSSLIGLFRKANPDVTLELHELDVTTMMAQTQHGLLDLCFLRDGEEAEGLTQKVLLKESYVAILPEKHRLAKHKRLSPDMLKHEDFILFSAAMAKLAHQQTLEICLAHGFRPNIVQLAPQWATITMLIQSGMGISIAPACVANLAIPGVVYRPSARKYDLPFRWRFVPI